MKLRRYSTGRHVSVNLFGQEDKLAAHPGQNFVAQAADRDLEGLADAAAVHGLQQVPLDLGKRLVEGGQQGWEYDGGAGEIQFFRRNREATQTGQAEHHATSNRSTVFLCRF